jgi:hypothetical protein
MSIGHKIIDEIIAQPMFTTLDKTVVVWNGNAADQIDAIVAGEVQGASQVESLVADLLAVVDRYSAEFTLPAASVLGCVETVKLTVWARMVGD